MTATTTAATRDAGDDRRRARESRGLQSTAAARAERLPPAPRERRPMLAALAVLLIVGGGAGAGLLALRADDRTPVLVAAQDIAAGAQITQDALTSTPVAAEGTMLVPADDAASLVGSYARVSVSAGQLIDTSMLTSDPMLGDGSVAVGAALAPGRTPASGLQPGDVVQLVRVDTPQGVVLVDDARVSSARSGDAEGVGGPGGTTVTFIVDARDGAEIAAVAAAGNLSAVLVSRGEPVGD
jgi:SAF domain